MSRTAEITGGASGIGLGLAETLLRRGDAVVICGRSEQKLRLATERLSEICGERLRSVVADVSVEGDVETLFSAASEAFGIPDMLVNNAGAFDGGPLEHLSLGS
ncbi:MAG: SDR family oxidoreductase, partial [Planctomycetaceae bacterium]